jgi:hypothetical protein
MECVPKLAPDVDEDVDGPVSFREQMLVGGLDLGFMSKNRDRSSPVQPGKRGPQGQPDPDPVELYMPLTLDQPAILFLKDIGE